MQRSRLKFCTVAFIDEMRRQGINAGRDAGGMRLDDFPPEQQSMLMKAIEKAINAASPAADPFFEKWSQAHQVPTDT